MQIQLKQSEIVTALKQYISQQGINLHARTVSVTFTAGRRESGISADILIDENDIPDLVPDHENTLVPALRSVPLQAAEASAEPEQVGEDPKPAPSVSLFGN